MLHPSYPTLYIECRKWYGYEVKEFIQGPGDTIYMPAYMAHAVMNIDENLSVTENYFLADSLDDWVHGMMTDMELIEEISLVEQEMFWRAMYFKHLEKEDREAVRSMRKQVEFMVNNEGSACYTEDEDEEEEVNEN